jgi:hypothetical protein
MSDDKVLPHWKGVRSNKPRREGEAFVLRDNTFVLKVYKQDSIPDTLRFARYLADQFNQLEEKKARHG